MGKDVQWKSGVVFTGKQDGLWEPTKVVSAEDIRHMRNRVREFLFAERLAEGALRDVESCAPCMARWILAGASAHDAAPALRRAVPHRLAEPSASTTSIHMVTWLQQTARLSDSSVEVVVRELEHLGVATIQELHAGDWEGLECWHALKPFEKRRILSAIK